MIVFKLMRDVLPRRAFQDMIMLQSNTRHAVTEKSALVPVWVGSVPKTSANVIEKSHALSRSACANKKPVEPFDQGLF